MSGSSGDASRMRPGPGPDEAEIVRFLELHPDFLARHPSLYLTLAPPARVHGEAVADHMQAMLAAARRRNRALQENVERRRAGRSLREQVDHALLGLLREADPLLWAASELALTLGVDAAQVCLEAGREGGHVRVLPAGVARRLLGGRDVTFRDAVAGDATLLHGAAAPLVRHEALVRLAFAGGEVGILALGSRDPACLVAGNEAPLALLGQAIAGSVERHALALAHLRSDERA